MSINDYINTKALTKRIAEVREELEHLLHIEGLLGGKPAKKRGRPAGSGKKTAAAKPAKKAKRGKRGNLSEDILKFLSTKGKEGAHVKDIAAAVGSKPVNVTAWTYSTGKDKVKKVKPATFALKG